LQRLVIRSTDTRIGACKLLTFDFPFLKNLTQRLTNVDFELGEKSKFLLEWIDWSCCLRSLSFGKPTCSLLHCETSQRVLLTHPCKRLLFGATRTPKSKSNLGEAGHVES